MKLTKTDCRKILDGVLKRSKADQTLAVLTGSESSLTRFANNGIHQNVTEESLDLTVRVAIGKRTAKASTNRLDSDSIQKAIDVACDLARFVPEEELPPLAGRCRYEALKRYDQTTARLTPRSRAEWISQAIEPALSQSLVAAGYLSNQVMTTAVANSAGMFAHDRHTQAEFSMTAMAGDSSGWVKDAAPCIEEIRIPALAKRAVQKALDGRSPRDLEPGRYTVILEPAAVADLLGFMTYDFGALSVHLKQSFITEKIGTRMFGENITIQDNVGHSLQMGLPFDGDGIPRERVKLVEGGVIRNLVYSATTARKMGRRPTGHGLFFEPDEMPMNIVMEGGRHSLAEMIASTPRGLLVTRFWYIREVDPTQKILTGMTRDGTFFVENGRVSHAVKNLRFNQGLVEMLCRATMMGRPVRASGEEHYGCIVVPPMKVDSFQFTGKTVF